MPEEQNNNQQSAQGNQAQSIQDNQAQSTQQSTQAQRVFPDADTSVNARFNKGENSEPLERKDKR